MIQKFFSTIHIFLLLNITFAILCICLAVYLFLAPGKVKTFTCERNLTEMHCQVENANWWKKSLEVYSQEEIWGAEVERVRWADDYEYYVNLIVNITEKHHLFPHHFESDAKKELAKINEFLNNSQSNLLTISKDGSIVFNFVGGFCLLLGMFGLSICLLSLVRYWLII